MDIQKPNIKNWTYKIGYTKPEIQSWTYKNWTYKTRYRKPDIQNLTYKTRDTKAGDTKSGHIKPDIQN